MKILALETTEAVGSVAALVDCNLLFEFRLDSQLRSAQSLAPGIKTLLAKVDFTAGVLGGQGQKGQAEVTFNVVPSGSKMVLTAVAYCTKHGLWECDPVEVMVEE